jgi:hypothetical protein
VGEGVITITEKGESSHNNPSKQIHHKRSRSKGGAGGPTPTVAGFGEEALKHQQRGEGKRKGNCWGG